ncbi:MAG: BamA/TamA family outer membrane protein, partial [Bacteroidota bacterium]|nr:BamA/TamA family outer membrane protein [Bacteroidota bacterium]
MPKKPANKKFLIHVFFTLLSFSFCSSGYTQQKSVDDTLIEPGYKIIAAGKQYTTNSFHQWLWGKHYRKEWAAPVKVKIVSLDTLAGGLTPDQEGGGKQTKSLRFKNPQGKEYVLRSIDKSSGKAMPEIFQHTFLENIINDQTSIAHPYAAITIPVMAQAGGIYHTYPQIVYVPEQERLGEFNKKFGNTLFLFEQKPSENWEEASYFGNSKEFVSTQTMLENIFTESKYRMDQVSFARARLFDMFINDWDRHEDQWQWATFEDDDRTIYRPVPRDRDQAYTKFDGVLLSMLLSSAHLYHLQSFNKNIKDIPGFNFTGRYLDRQLINELSQQQWVDMAKNLQQSLTDSVIELAIKQLPPEIFPISGEEIIGKLKSRRNHLVDYATKYYTFLAKEVEVVGTKQNDLFEVKRTNENEMTVNVYHINEEGVAKTKPFYSRSFFKNETHEVRIYGLAGNDEYHIDGTANSGIKLRIIGGANKDVYNNQSSVPLHNTHIYDNKDNEFKNMGGAKKHLSNNPFINEYRYDGFEYNAKGIKKIINYNSDDHIHVGLGYKFEKKQWRKYPFGFQHEIDVKYSLSEKAFSTEYNGSFTQLIGKWNLALYANYDAIRWRNFYGIGNETEMLTRKRDYHRMRTREFIASAGINRKIRINHYLGLNAFYQTIKIIDDKDRFLFQHMGGLDPHIYNTKKIGGARFDYSYLKVNDNILPTKGINFSTAVTYTQNLKNRDSSFIRYSSSLNLYLPLSKSLGLVIKTGAATLTGNPEFYQLNRLGGGTTLRGFRKYRFYGTSMFYNQNELQWIRNIKSHLYNGKAGLLGLFDLGRVWQPGEKSNELHTAIGGGIVLSPFNKIGFAATYA